MSGARTTWRTMMSTGELDSHLLSNCLQWNSTKVMDRMEWKRSVRSMVHVPVRQYEMPPE